MKTSLRMRFKMLLLNIVYPCWWVSGRRIDYLADDWSEIRIRLPRVHRNRSPHGFIYGGSLFSTLDAIPSLQIYMLLGPKYAVFDKSSTIQFKKPGHNTLYATSIVSLDEIESIKKHLESHRTLERVYHVNLVDSEGVVHVSLEKHIHFSHRADRNGYKHISS